MNGEWMVQDHAFGSRQMDNGRSELGRSGDDDTDEINGRVVGTEVAWLLEA